MNFLLAIWTASSLLIAPLAAQSPETEETPIVEVVETEETTGLTEEEVLALIDNAYSIVLSFWDKFVAGASITSILGAVLVFYLNSKRTQGLSKRSDLLISSVQALQVFSAEMAREERDLKQAILSMITVSNIDALVKKQLLDQLNNSSIDVAALQKTVDVIQAQKTAQEQDEVASLLND